MVHGTIGTCSVIFPLHMILSYRFSERIMSLLLNVHVSRSDFCGDVLLLQLLPQTLPKARKSMGRPFTNKGPDAVGRAFYGQ